MSRSSLADIEQIQTSRCRVEGVAARRGAPRAEEADLAQMRRPDFWEPFYPAAEDGDGDAAEATLAAVQARYWPAAGD